MKTLFMAKIKLAVAVIGTVLVVDGGGGAVALRLAAGEPARVEVRPAGQVSMDTRWWGEHEFASRLAEATGLRWAITDGISGRGRCGGENLPAATVAEEFEKGTGIKCEVIGGILVSHRPHDAKRKEMEAKLPAGGEEAVRAAWLLGYLKDATAWPALAKAACSKDAAVALSAAGALRRLDGEENFDLRRWAPRAGDGGLAQLPLGAAFKESVPAADLEALAKSPYVALREAAARIAAGSGSGKALVEKLGQDASFWVRQAAARAERAWQAFDAKPVARPVRKPDLAPARARFGTKSDDRPPEWAHDLAAYGTEEDLKKLAEMMGYGGQLYVLPEVLAYNGGGPAVTALFRQLAGTPPRWPPPAIAVGKYGLSMLLDGEKLASEMGPTVGNEDWSLSSELLLARLSGPPALPHLQKVLTKRGHVAPLAVGYIGGPDGVRMIEPLLASENLSTAIAAARGLGESSQLSAVAPLVKALGSPNRVVRSRAALGLGRIGGPEAAKALTDLLKTEKEYLPKRSACVMLKEIATGDKSQADAVAAAEKELAEFVPNYNPVNKQFGPDFPVGKLVKLGEEFTISAVGETACAVDQYTGLWVQYGGCTPHYNNECLGFDVASGKWFVVRVPENMGLFYNESRPSQGCSRAMVFDPRSRKVWINHAVGGSGHPFNGALMGWGVAASYDVALDRFEAFPDRGKRNSGEGANFYAADSAHGVILSEWMGPVTTAIDTATSKLVDIPLAGLPDLPYNSNGDSSTYDPVSGLILRTVRTIKYHDPKMLGLWLLDVGGGKARKSKSMPEGTQGRSCLIYDSLTRDLDFFLNTGVWRYEREKDEWSKVLDGDQSLYVLDYDAQHNVYLGLKWHQFFAIRLKNVPAGTKAFYGEIKPMPEERKAP